ncbi:MAG: RNA pseudouridine synthase [Spirochaetales bacterium]|nr:RNA pseudouridine synthase [Spirochaetales bacterium]
MLEERILYEDDDALVFNKIPGELTQGDRRGDPSLIDMLSAGTTYRFLEPVHRLDRPASGVVLFAKTKAFFSAMTELFRARAVEKVYWAVTERPPVEAAGVLRHHLRPDRRRNVVSARPAREGESEPNAVLSYRLLAGSERYYFLIVRPSTGRQHQIRAQLAAAGAPIKGDVKYGARRSNPDRSILLHARELSFAHPFTKYHLRSTAPPPRDVLWDLFVRAADTPRTRF